MAWIAAVIATATFAGAAVAAPEDPQEGGQWGPVIPWPHIAVSAANLPDGRILTWSGAERDTWPAPERTYSATWDPGTGTFQELLYQGHNMFCAHIAMMADGRVFVNGGRNQSNSPWTSIFNFQNNQWTAAANMASGGRWYPTTLELGDGRIFTAIGTATLPRYPEIWNPDTGGWQIKNGIDFDAMVLTQYSGTHGEANWFPLLHVAPNGQIFHSGPTPRMHYIDPTGNGSYQEVAQYSAAYHKDGTTLMYDVGKLFTVGGWQSGTNPQSTNKGIIIDINGPSPQIAVIEPMQFNRRFHNGVLLPTGEVLVIGGNTSGQKFSDNGAVLPVEIWDPDNTSNGQWRTGASMSVPRNYHSIALLLTDGRVLSAGSGYCSDNPTCGGASHRDGQVYSPPYLFDSSGNLATRPSITSAPPIIVSEQVFTVQGTAGMPKFTMLKMGSTTHGLNTDARLVPVPFTETSPGTYQLTAHSNQNVLTPGYWMLFGVNASGVPSIAHVLRANTDASPWITAPSNQASTVGNGVSLQITAGDGDDDPLIYTATGLPPGLGIDPITGLISGTPTTAGNYAVTVTVDDSDEGIAQANFQWAVTNPGAICEGCLDFTIYTTESYAGQDQHGNVSVQDNGATIVLSDNTWRRTVQTFDITADTILAFDYQSTSRPELGGIGFDSFNAITPNRTFKLYGSQSVAWDIQAFENYSGTSVKSYEIPVGQYYTGTGMHLVFVNDHDAGLGSNSRFSNVRVIQPSTETLADLVDPSPSESGGEATLAVVPNQTGLEFNWNFGDGSGDTGFGSQSSVDHTFSDPGLYVITVTVRDPSTSEEELYTFIQLVHAPLTANRPSVSSSIVAHPALSQVWVVNPDHDSVSVIDTNYNGLIAEITVGDQPSTVAIAPDSTAWVVNKKSGTISIVDGASLNVIDTITLDNASQPYGIAVSPSEDRAYVTLEGTGDLLKLNTVTRNEVSRVYLGPHLRHLSVSSTGSRVYVSRFVTPPLPDESTDAPVVESGGQYFGAEVLAVNAGTMALAKTIVLRWSDRLVSEHQGPGIPNYLGPPVISPDGLSAHVPSKQDNILAGALRGGQGMTFDQTVRAITSEINLVTENEDFAGRIDHDNASVASHLVYGPWGVYAFTALEGNREVAVSNSYTGVELARFDVGRAPQGLALSPDGDTLYVQNFMDRTVGIYDVSALTQSNVMNIVPVVDVPTTSTETLSANVFIGKQLFYDARDTRLAADSYMSCASCHNDGGADGRIWDFTGLGEGLRNTITLEGRAGMAHGFLHWSNNFDEIQDFEGQIRNFAGGTGLMSDSDFFSGTRFQPLGAPKTGLSADLDALAAYVSSLNRVSDSPYRNADGTLSAAGEQGKLVFDSNGCADCHTAPRYTDSSVGNAHDVGTIKPSSGNRLGGPLTGIDTPTLLGVWKTAPYLHDGSVLDLTEAVDAHSALPVLTTQQLNDVAMYLQELDNTTADGCDVCYLDFSTLATISYAGQDQHGSVAIADNGATLVLTNNTWRRTVQTFDVTADTVLEFDFQSSDEAEVQGIGFDQFNAITPNRTFRIYGTQGVNWDIEDFDTYSGGGVVHYSIPVGQYYTGTGMHLVFVNDHDAGLGSESRFSNIQITGGSSGGNSNPTITNPGNQSTALNSGVNLAVSAADSNPGDTLTFSASGLPPGLSLNTGSGVITGVATTVGVHDVVVSVSDGNGGFANAPFQWTVYDPSALCPNCIDFSVVATESYAGQDQHGDVTILDGGATILLQRNTWRRTTQAFTITPDTILEFDFQSSSESELSGIGFDSFNAITPNRVFKLYGTQSVAWDITNFETYSGSAVLHYVIPVGLFYTGTGMRLVLVNDKDAGSGTNSRFSNVQVYEP
jgi:YVTN family beta-propeller protein